MRIAILSYARTPIGAFQSQFYGLTAVELGSYAVMGALNKLGDQEKTIKDGIDEAIYGHVLQV